jgi:hypothetical protein
MTLLRSAHRRLLRALFGLDDDGEPLANRPLPNPSWVNRRWAAATRARHQRQASRAPRVLKRWQATIAARLGHPGAGG